MSDPLTVALFSVLCDVGRIFTCPLVTVLLLTVTQRDDGISILKMKRVRVRQVDMTSHCCPLVNRPWGEHSDSGLLGQAVPCVVCGAHCSGAVLRIWEQNGWPTDWPAGHMQTPVGIVKSMLGVD